MFCPRDSGHERYIYDVWGPNVGIANQMESRGEKMALHVSNATYKLISDAFTCRTRPLPDLLNEPDLPKCLIDAPPGVVWPTHIVEMEKPGEN